MCEILKMASHRLKRGKSWTQELSMAVIAVKVLSTLKGRFEVIWCISEFPILILNCGIALRHY